MLRSIQQHVRLQDMMVHHPRPHYVTALPSPRTTQDIQANGPNGTSTYPWWQPERNRSRNSGDSKGVERLLQVNSTNS